ncbi:hypothetical protein TNCV_4672631 [Trichonephila clavipes]|nr:hypothetical protein TNCV_4672631 [Trichonephila clavipes]
MHWLGSAHIRSLKFVNGEMTFSSCPCSYSASPTHFIDCIEASVRQLRNEGVNGRETTRATWYLGHSLGIWNKMILDKTFSIRK